MSEDKQSLPSEDVEARVAEKFGLDKEEQGDLIKQIAEDQSVTHKEHSKDIAKKKEFRQKLADAGLYDIKKGEYIEKKNVKPEGKANKSKKDDFDYGEKSYLAVKKLDDKIALEKIKDYLAENSGKTLEDAVTNKFLLAEINEARDLQKTKDATPSSSKRAPTSGKGSVDYWVSKGELPPVDQVQLRRDVLNKRIELEKQDSKFANQSVVSKSS